MAKQQPKKKAPARKTPVKKQAPGRTGTTGKSGPSPRKVAAKKTAVKKTAAKKTTAKKAAAKKTALKKTAARKTVAKRPAVKKGAPVKRASKAPAQKRQAVKKVAPRKVAVKKQVVKKVAAPKQAVRKLVKKAATRMAPRSTSPSRDVERALQRVNPAPQWPDAVDAGHDVHVHLGIDQRGPDPRAQLHAVQGSPNELHPGSTRKTGKSHDRPGSQLERKRHQYPSSNVPNRGSAHTTQVKGKRRNEQPPGE